MSSVRDDDTRWNRNGRQPALLGAVEMVPGKKKLEEVFSAFKKDSFRYKFDPSGFVVVTAPDAPESVEVWSVNLIAGL